MIKDGKIFGKFNVLDLSIVIIVILAITGIILVKSGKYITASEVIKKQATIEFDVALRGVKLSSNRQLFKVGDKSFITIRNVPYTSLIISKAVRLPVMTTFLDPNDSTKAIAVADPSEPYFYNFNITLKDKALITDDGPVIGGNKIKTGLIVSLEGSDYRLNGIVSGVRILSQK